VPMIFRAGFLVVRGENFILAVVLPDHIEHVRQAVVVIVADVWAEQCLRHRMRRVVFVKNGDEAGKDLFRLLLLRRVVDFVARAVKNDARMIPVAAPRCQPRQFSTSR